MPETSRNTVFVRAAAEAACGGAAADAADGLAWYGTMHDDRSQACTKTVNGYGELTTSILDKSTFSLEVERSIARVTALFPFSDV